MQMITMQHDSVCVCVCVCVHLLLWLEVSVNDAQAMKVIERQSKFCEVKLHILFCEHDLQHTHTHTHTMTYQLQTDKNKMKL